MLITKKTLQKGNLKVKEDSRGHFQSSKMQNKILFFTFTRSMKRV